ncbi:hypothetical protein PR048_018190 [Dryococelus australis]|uniref:Uncharacterized protein n=1 Tax=Dryococelus australis TaxID=614101 RepID=A0ABQ9HBQ6_9NEOP|nr:hypothetical protein PR048_018190 [Dryococelus australis]
MWGDLRKYIKEVGKGNLSKINSLLGKHVKLFEEFQYHENNTTIPISLFDFKDKKCLLSSSKVSLGFIEDKMVKELINKSDVTERWALELRHEPQNFIFLMVENLVAKTPIRS